MVALTPDEIQKVMCHLLEKDSESGKFWAALIALIFLTGPRISEALQIRMGQIADNTGKLHPKIMLHKAKAGKNSTRLVEIDTQSALAKVIEEWIAYSRHRYGRIRQTDYVFAWQHNTYPVNRMSAWRAFTRAYKATALNYVPRGCHGIRKAAGHAEFYISKELSGSEFMAAVATQSFYGHTSLDVTRAYLELSRIDNTEIARRHGDIVNLGNVLYKHKQGDNQITQSNSLIRLTTI